MDHREATRRRRDDAYASVEAMTGAEAHVIASGTPGVSSGAPRIVPARDFPNPWFARISFLAKMEITF
jgi:hypothetical protein